MKKINIKYSLVILIFVNISLSCSTAKKNEETVNNQKDNRLKASPPSLSSDKPATSSVEEKSILLSSNSVDEFYNWLQKNSNKITVNYEREILLSYVKFLSTLKPSDGVRVIRLLKESAMKKGGPLPTQWLNFFEGNANLIHLGKSIGSLSLQRLYPMVLTGNQTAINLVLMYSASVQTDGADAEGLAEYQQALKKYNKTITEFKAYHAEFLIKYPIQWIKN